MTDPPKRIRHRGPSAPGSAPAALAPLPLRPNATLADFAQQWLKLRDKRTRQADSDRLRDHVLPLLGGLRVRELTVEHVSDVVKKTLAKKGMTVKSARNAYDVFAALLGDALARGMLDADPRAIPPDSFPEESLERPLYSDDEVQALTSDERLSEPQRIYNSVAFGTGLGNRQLCQLTFGDWREQLEEPPSAELEAAIEAWRARGFERSYGRPPSASDPLLPRASSTPEPHTEGSAFKALRRACVTVGIKTRSPLAIRNTHEARRGTAPRPPSAS
ncbi:MAG TPA: hypothetical protein VNN80_18745 [Polyangiaceae bacterium]|nr:hypothetical protein [Polyangiaceae bacterium]